MGRHSAYVPPVETMQLPVYSGDEQALGAAAVTAGHTADAYRSFSDNLAARGDSDAAEQAEWDAHRNDQSVRDHLDQIRERLQKDDKPAWLAGYISYFAGDDFARAQHNGQTRHANIIDWLGDRKHGASDRQVFRFFNNHIHYLFSEQQDSGAHATIETSRWNYIDGISLYASLGWVSKDALQSLGKIQDARVVIGDAWDTYMHNRAAHYTTGDDYMVIGQGGVSGPWRGNVREKIRRGFGHEGAHMQFENDDMPIPEWFREGFAEHVNQFLLYGHPEIMSPDVRNDAGACAVFRRFLATILSGPSGRDNNHELLRAATLAYTSQNNESWQQFTRAYDAVWGRGAWDNLNQDIMARSQDRIADGENHLIVLEEVVAQENTAVLEARSKGPGRHRRAKGRHEAGRMTKKSYRHVGAAVVSVR